MEPLHGSFSGQKILMQSDLEDEEEEEDDAKLRLRLEDDPGHEMHGDSPLL